MGCAISCALFEKFSTFVEWCVRRAAADRLSNESEHFLCHYVDDYLFAASAGTDRCDKILDIFHIVCQDLGVPIAVDKTVYPTEVLVFLGLELDTINMVVRIPLEKIQELKELIASISSAVKIKLAKLQSLIGSLNFACRAIVPGRAFSRRLIDATRGVTNPQPTY
jgi:hypothetical protein